MKESSLYLNFFKRNLLWFILFPVIGLSAAYILLGNVPILYQYSSLYELVYDQSNVQVKISEADEAVTLLRSTNLHSELRVPSAVTIFKPGPLSINLETSSVDQNLAEKDLQTLSQYLQSHYQVKKIGDNSLSQAYPPLLKYLLLGLAGGFVLAFIFSLAREYFRNF